MVPLARFEHRARSACATLQCIALALLVSACGDAGQEPDASTTLAEEDSDGGSETGVLDPTGMHAEGPDTLAGDEGSESTEVGSSEGTDSEAEATSGSGDAEDSETSESTEETTNDDDVLEDCGFAADEPVYLRSQAEVDAFPRCRRMRAPLHITPCPDGNFDPDTQDSCPVDEGELEITGLQALRHLEAIESWFNIIGNEALTDLHGLEALASVERPMAIVGNASLSQLHGLSGLREISGLTIFHNDALRSTGGIDQLETISDDLAIVDNLTLKQIDGFARLRSLKNLTVEGNSNLEALDGFPMFKADVQPLFLAIVNNPKLHSIAGFAGRLALVRRLHFENNVKLADLSAFPGIDRLIAGFQALDLPELGDIGPLMPQTADGPVKFIRVGVGAVDHEFPGKVNTLSFIDCPQLSSISIEGPGLDDATLEFHALAQLSLLALDGVTHLQELELLSIGITEFSGLSALKSVENLRIELNPNHSDADARAFAEGLDHVGNLVVMNNG